jgi:hypothetical protein
MVRSPGVGQVRARCSYEDPQSPTCPLQPPPGTIPTLLYTQPLQETPAMPAHPTLEGKSHK